MKSAVILSCAVLVACGDACGAAVSVDFSGTGARIKPLHGVNRAPMRLEHKGSSDGRDSQKEFAEAALGQSAAVVFDDEDAMVAFADIYAPEHLIINTEKPWTIADRVQAAGSVFVGAYTPESAGDYASGTNHTLPTCGWARSFSGVNMDSFMRKMTIQVISREGLEALGGTIITMAEAEGLQAHADAVKIRLEGDGK